MPRWPEAKTEEPCIRCHLPTRSRKRGFPLCAGCNRFQYLPELRGILRGYSKMVSIMDTSRKLGRSREETLTRLRAFFEAEDRL